jgi:hypothetical protein
MSHVAAMSRSGYQALAQVGVVPCSIGAYGRPILTIVS